MSDGLKLIILELFQYSQNILMEDVFNDIMKSPLALKKTIHVFSRKTNYYIIIRVDSFYLENKKKFVWMKPWKCNVYIYGNPFPNYNF